MHGCPCDRVERSGYESECNVGVEGEMRVWWLRQQVGCVSGGVKRESVGMWVAPIDPVKGEWEEVKRLGLIGVGLQGKY